MMQEPWDEFVHQDLFLLNTTAICFVIVDFRQCRGFMEGGGVVLYHNTQSFQELSFIELSLTLVPLRKVELSSLPVALKNTWMQC